MDIFKQNKYLVVIIIILIILNLCILTTMWLDGPPQPKQPNRMQDSSNEHQRISSLLKEELMFSDDQIEKYLVLRRINLESIKVLQNEIRDLKRQIFDKVFFENSHEEISDSLLIRLLDKQGEIEKLTYQHFADLKNLCNSEQQDNLQSLIHRLLPPPVRNEDAPPPGQSDNRRPPPPPPGQSDNRRPPPPK